MKDMGKMNMMESDMDCNESACKQSAMSTDAHKKVMGMSMDGGSGMSDKYVKNDVTE